MFIANLTGSTWDVAHRKPLSWHQDDIAHCAGLRIGYKNDCEMQAEKGNVGPWNIDLRNK